MLTMIVKEVINTSTITIKSNYVRENYLLANIFGNKIRSDNNVYNHTYVMKIRLG
mgnify:CR=1 FL=1